jgi:thioredoxin 1
MIPEIESAAEFKELVGQGRYTLVNFYATWNGPSKMMKPVLNRLAQQYATISFINLDIDILEEVAGEAGVSAAPTYLVYVWGNVVDQLVGGSEGKLEAMVKKYEGVPAPVKPEYETVESYDRSDDPQHTTRRVK